MKTKHEKLREEKKRKKTCIEFSLPMYMRYVSDNNKCFNELLKLKKIHIHRLK